MTRSTALKRLSALLLRGGDATGAVQSDLARISSAERFQCIATSSTAAASGTHAPPVQPPAAPSAAATPAQRQSHAGGSNASGGGRSMGPVLLLPAAVAAGLGTWQLARRAEKQQQLDDRLAAMRADPLDLFAATERLMEFSPVAAEGELDEADTIFVGPRPRSAMGGTIAGKLVVTPLRDAERGVAAMVVRGWAPAAWEPDRRAAPQWVRVQGVTRASEARGGFVPDNVPGASPTDPASHWYWLEGPALAKAAGSPPDTPLIEVITDAHPRDAGPSAMEVLGGRTASLGNAPTAYPEPRTREELLQFPVMPQGHLNYAATWFTLSGAIAVAALAAMRRRRPPIPQSGG